MEPPTKRPSQLFDDDEDASSSESENNLAISNGADKTTNGFKINDEYARRFEYNKKREETQQCMYIASFQRS